MQVSDNQKYTGTGHPPVDVTASGGPPSGMPPSTAGAPGAPGGSQAGRPPFPFPPAPDPSDLIPLVISPETLQKQQQGKTGAAASPVAFIFMPGAFLYPRKDYSALSTELKNAFETLFTGANIPVYLVMAAVDWSKMNPTVPGAAEQVFTKAIEDGLQAAEDAGFTKNSAQSPSGRLDNVFIGMHSVSVLAASGWPFHRAAGVVLFGASLIATGTFWPSVHTYPRPILHIFGEMDGQAHQCRAALSAAEAALSAPSLGRKSAAKECPIALIEGMNHAQFSNEKINYARGDLDPYEKEQKEALEEVAAVVTAFLTAHASPVHGQQEENFQKAKVAAIDSLDQMTLRAARHFTPYFRALGRTAAEDLLACTEGACDTSACYGEDLATPLAYSHGAEYIPFDSPYIQACTAHPAELHVAEKFAIRAQKQLLESGLSSDIVAGIPVAAVAHTSKHSFTYSQPVIMQCPDAPHGLGVKVHVLVQREAFPEGSGGGAMTRSPTAATTPVYALKLKSGEQIACAVENLSSNMQPGQVVHGGARAVGAGAGARLSSEVYEEALVLAGARAREIFQKRGFDLLFKEDRRGGGGGRGRPAAAAGGDAEGEKGRKKKEAQHAQQHELEEPYWESAKEWIEAPMKITITPISSTTTTTPTTPPKIEEEQGQRQQQQASEGSQVYHHTRTPSNSDVDISIRSGSTGSFSVHGGRMCTAVMPALHVDANKQGPFDDDSFANRFAGAVYIKVPSLAWCMEWILVRGMRKEVSS